MTSQTKHAIPSWAFLIVILLYLSLLFLLQVFSSSNADFSTLTGDKNINLLKWLQLLASVFTFVFPVFVLALVIRQERLKFFNLHRHINYIQATNVVILFVVTLPLVSVSAILNQYILDLPFLADFKLANLAKEKALNDLIQSFFADKSIGGFITNLIVVALSAAVTEEIFFRGALQRLFHENIKSIHITVWLTAIIFSAFHMQFSGFIPRTILGALLGYVYIYTGNLWLPIIGHFINNGLAVVGNHFNIEQLNDVDKNVKPNNMLYIISIVSIGIIIFLLVKIRNNESLKLSSNIFGRAKVEGDS
jgi:uncharacterized protein